MSPCEARTVQIQWSELRIESVDVPGPDVLVIAEPAGHAAREDPLPDRRGGQPMFGTEATTSVVHARGSTPFIRHEPMIV